MNDDLNYVAPELYLVAVTVERGYANSLEDPFEKEEIIW
jgi:hypothetical protein